jgi:hypothetical protein
LELEAEVADLGEDRVQVGLVDDLADELGAPGAVHETQAAEERLEAVGEAAGDDDPDSSWLVCVHSPPSVGASWVSRHHPARGFTQGDPRRRV